ncbi:MAG: tetratricopeptide repeat protein [Clostridia bacterium]|nr:tetratricopeptide repeat protein [Clostridia bacterium]
MDFCLAEIRELQKSFGESYKNGDFKKALFLGKQLLELYKKNGDLEYPGFAEDTHNVAFIFDELGFYDKAAEYYRQAASLKKARCGESAAYADTLNNLAIAYSNLGENEKALKTHLCVLAVRQKMLGREHMDYIHTLYNLGNVYEALTQYDKALENHGQALEQSRCCKAMQIMDVADIHISMARCFEKTGNYKKAIFYYEFALEIIEKKLGIRSLPYITNALSLAFVCEKAEFTGLAVEYCERVVEIRRKIFPERHLDYVNNLSYLAALCCKDGQFEKAFQLHKKALELVEHIFGQKHLLYADILDMLAMDFCFGKDFTKALEYSQKALELRETLMPEEAVLMTKSYMTLGEIAMEMGNCTLALSYYQRSLHILEEDNGENRSTLSTVWYKIARLFDHQGVYEAAAFLYELALKMRNSFSSANKEADLSLMNAHVQMRLKQGEHEKAVFLCLEMERMAKELYGKHHPAYAIALKQLGVAYQKSGELVAASNYLEEALAIQKEALDEDNPIYIKTLEAFAEVCFYRGDCLRAIQLYKERDDVNFEETAQEQGEAACTLLAIGNCYLKLGEKDKARVCLAEAEGKMLRNRLLPNERYRYLKELYAAGKNGSFPISRPVKRRMRDGERRCLEDTVSFLAQVYKNNDVKTSREKERRAISAFSLGEIYQMLGKKEEAIYWYSLAEKEAEPKYYVRACTGLGEAYLAYGEEEKAYRKFINAKEYIAEYGNMNSLEYCRLLGHIGDYFLKKGNKETALRFYHSWNQLYEALCLPECASYDSRIDKIGRILTAFERYKEAMELYYILSVSIRNREGETTKFARLLLRIATLHIQIGEAKEAEPLLDHVLILAGKSGITTEPFGKICDKVGRLYSMAGLEDKAMEALKLAYQENLQGKKCLTKEGLQLLCELLWKKGDSKAYFSAKNGREIE